MRIVRKIDVILPNALAAECEAAQAEYRKARNIPITEHRIDGKRVNAASTRLVAAWAALDKAYKQLNKRDKGVN